MATKRIKAPVGDVPLHAVRLLKPHEHEDKLRKPGEVIFVDEHALRFLKEHGVIADDSN